MFILAQADESAMCTFANYEMAHIENKLFKQIINPSVHWQYYLCN